MKIKILKDIPGYKAGHIHDTDKNGVMGDHSNNTYHSTKGLIDEGWAEEVKDVRRWLEASPASQGRRWRRNSADKHRERDWIKPDRVLQGLEGRDSS